MAPFIRLCARPTWFVILGLLIAAPGCGDGAVVAPKDGPGSAADPAPAEAAQAPKDDPALRQAKLDAESGQRSGDGLLEAQTSRTYATVLVNRGDYNLASQILLGSIGAACAVWGGDDAARRAAADEQINGGCDDLEELVNSGIIQRRVTHGEAVIWYGQLHALVSTASRRAHAAALRHQQSHHAANADNYEDAARWAAEAVSERQALGLKVPAAWSLNQLGYVRLSQGKHEQAWETLGQAAQSVCGVGLNAVARATIQNLAAVIRSLIEAKKLKRAKELLANLWFVAGGDLDATPKRLGWTGAEQSFVLELSKELHLSAGDLDAAEQALLAILWVSHRGRVFRPDVDAALWLEMARFAHEERKAFDRAMEYCAKSMELHVLIEHTLGRAWVHVRRGSILLEQAADPRRSAGDARAYVETAVAECTTALQLFRECGNHRNGRLMAMQHLQRADELRKNPDGRQAWADQIVPLLGEPRPKPADVFHFPPVDELWKKVVATLPSSAPLALVVRDGDAWVVTDLVDNEMQRVPFSWLDREVVVRLLRFRIGGATLRAPIAIGGYSVYIPPLHGAQILRNGLILPVGPKRKGARDYSSAKGKFPPPLLRGTKPK